MEIPPETRRAVFQKYIKCVTLHLVGNISKGIQLNSVLRHVLTGNSWKYTLKLCMELPSISLTSHHAVLLLQVSSVYRGTLYCTQQGLRYQALDDPQRTTTIIFYGSTTWQQPSPIATVWSLITNPPPFFFLRLPNIFLPHCTGIIRRDFMLNGFALSALSS